MTERAVEPLPVIIDFNHLEDCLASLLPALELAVAQEFIFKRAPERFHGGVIVAVALAAHARLDAGLLELLAVRRAGVLRSSIGMMQEAFRRMTLRDGHLQSIQSQAGLQVLLHGPAHDPAAVEIHDRGQIEPAFGGRDVGDVTDPNLIDAFGSSSMGQPIGRDGIIVLAVGGADAKGAAAPRGQALLAHQPFHPLMIAVVAPGSESVSQTRTAVVGFELQEKAFKEQLQLLIELLARAGLTFGPGIVSTARELQRPAQITERIKCAQLLHSLAALGGLERMASVFFKISH